MRFAASAVLLGSVASMAAAVASPHSDHHHYEHVPEDPQNDCHFNCGTATAAFRSGREGFCEDKSWKKRFDQCLVCADSRIWKIYGPGIRSAAAKCNLDATPKSVGGGASSKAELATPAASTTAVVTSAAPSQTSASSVSTAVEQATSVSSRRHDPVHHHDSDHHHDPAHHHVPAPHASAATGASAVASAPTTAAGELNSTATGAVIVTAGASKNILSGLAVAGVAALVAVGLF